MGVCPVYRARPNYVLGFHSQWSTGVVYNWPFQIQRGRLAAEEPERKKFQRNMYPDLDSALWNLCNSHYPQRKYWGAVQHHYATYLRPATPTTDLLLAFT